MGGGGVREGGREGEMEEEIKGRREGREGEEERDGWSFYTIMQLFIHDIVLLYMYIIYIVYCIYIIIPYGELLVAVFEHVFC